MPGCSCWVPHRPPQQTLPAKVDGPRVCAAGANAASHGSSPPPAVDDPHAPWRLSVPAESDDKKPVVQMTSHSPSALSILVSQVESWEGFSRKVLVLLSGSVH
eukprot:gnl/TRDRNA2_/TRDRNA2_162920_c4_seq5.p1 gnl/TRDRNA2_/TRDRNA2_162920_c4~~gnl/TRDRNA2_/TRDRNA2_162920_c4_seq5.p1  ORF type:complete len:103 (-),score=7.31 gnl/TRDRNA2_/TRDRNA2_162920_c4_seq5:170-478(-)